jgi:hypothetical protein
MTIVPGIIFKDGACTSIYDIRVSNPELIWSGVHFRCYCTAPVPYDSTGLTWVSTFAPDISMDDEPMHADFLPFPFKLPLYPNRPIIMVAYVLRKKDESIIRPMYLGTPPSTSFAVERYCKFNSECWQQTRKFWTCKAGMVSDFLACAFDPDWELEGVVDGDMFLEQGDATPDDLDIQTSKIKQTVERNIESDEECDEVGDTRSPVFDFEEYSTDEEEDDDEDKEDEDDGELESSDDEGKDCDL